MKIPYIPEDAPFSADQRAWLAGFLAGLHSRAAMGGEGAAPGMAAASAAVKAQPLHILYGTQTGNAERVAMDAAACARALGLAPEVLALDDVSMEQLAKLRHVIVVASTYGEGEMPDNAQLFWEALSSGSAPRLESLRFAVLALGDTGYDGFCQAGKLLDTRFEQLGATRIAARRDCDVDYEDAAAAWLGETLPLGRAMASPSPQARQRLPARPRAGAARTPMRRRSPSTAVFPAKARPRKSAITNSSWAKAALPMRQGMRWASCR